MFDRDTFPHTICRIAIERARQAEGTLTFTAEDIYEAICVATNKLLGTVEVEPTTLGSAALSEAIMVELYSTDFFHITSYDSFIIAQETQELAYAALEKYHSLGK